MAHPRDRARRSLTPERLEEIKKIKEKKKKLEEKKDLTTVGKWLFFPAIILGILFFISLAVTIQSGLIDSMSLIIGSTILFIPILFFSILGFIAKNKPYFATLTGLVIYSAYILISALINSNNIYSGIIFKALIILSLSQGLRVALKHKKSTQKQENIIDDIEF